jgi:HEAT repeat protein
MVEQIRSAVQAFGDDNSNGRVLRDLLERNSNEFADAAGDALADFRETPGYLYLLVLLNSAALLLQSTLRVAEKNPDALHSVLRAAQRIDPLLASRIVKRAAAMNAESGPVNDLSPGDPQDVLETAVASLRRLPLLKRLLFSSTPRAKSRAALLIGKLAPSQKWFYERLADPDERIRANAVESLWGSTDQSVAEIYGHALLDPSGRVVANAFVGIHLAGSRRSLSGLVNLSQDVSHLRRASAAWAMGEIGDPFFVSHLKRLLGDPEELVRTNAARAIARIESKTPAPVMPTR